MHLYRKTAIVQFELFSGATEGSLPLANERDFGVILIIEGVTYPAQNFRSPINDEQWRQFDRRLRDCNVNHDATGYRGAASIRSLAHQLFSSMVAVSPALREFLARAGEPRRLVIQTTRPELHLLPWAAMIDDSGVLLASGDLSVVQSWANFSLMEATTANSLRLMTVLGTDTNQVTASALDGMPPEIHVADGNKVFQDGKLVDNVDILHLEEHGDAVTNRIGDVFSTTLADTFANASMALLWSCCSGAANSWGESPALCLHRAGAGFVLSFLAELHNLDAQSISLAFYRDVFGPAASRDPETALLRIRADKFANEFPFANWASMTIYMRAPLDLSALPLNGPRVPQASWTANDVEIAASLYTSQDVSPIPEVTNDAGTHQPAPAVAGAQETATAASPAPTEAKPTASLWQSLATAVSELQAGTLNEFHGFESLPRETTNTLPLSAFKAWRGNVIRLDGGEEPLQLDVLKELDVPADALPQTDAAERLVWFFRRIERYGSPLIVWTNTAKRHLAFLRTIEPSSTLTFLLMHGPQPAPTIIDLMNENRLDEAQKACDSLPDPCGDDLLSAAYFAYARSEETDKAVGFMRRVSNKAEMLLLIANFISRRGIIPNPKPDWLLSHPDGKLTSLQQQHCQEDCFRKVISDPGTEAPLRESGRAKHELGYLLQSLGKTNVAEMLYGQALAELEKCPHKQHDFRWHGSLGMLLRDWADLMSSSPERIDKARELLARAMAIHSFHGRRLQIAYCLDTAARIALTGCRYSEAIQNAVDSANVFEILKNWRGWGEAMKVLFDCLAETRETARMHSLADLAIDKLEGSNLPQEQRDRLRRAFTYEKANANWIAGKLAEARSELEKLGLGSTDTSNLEFDPEFEPEVKRLWRFLALSPQS
ncbi:MAG TPA: tetratricopeptide repeat protein [Terracidiphilus sp.]|nr:tetratricopeptide repeat protein [Terracidiphilus sp.]